MPGYLYYSVPYWVGPGFNSFVAHELLGKKEALSRCLSTGWGFHNEGVHGMDTAQQWARSAHRENFLAMVSSVSVDY